MSAEESLQRAEVLLERLEQTRQELESTQDPDRAIEILRTEEFSSGRYSTSFLEESGRRLATVSMQ